MRIYFATNMTNPFRRKSDVEIEIDNYRAELREIRQGLDRIRSTYDELARIERRFRAA